jgi:hypothetical protein
MGGAYNILGRKVICIRCIGKESTKDRDRRKVLGIDGGVKWILKYYGGRFCTGDGPVVGSTYLKRLGIP